jgi:uncharacterized membrane protein YdcZ (DUF606 family)
MTLFQNLNALYFFYPRQEKQINMHTVFWALFVGMLLYAVICRPRPTERPLPADDAAESRFPWLKWLAGGYLALGFIILAAGFVNNEQTMKSANTRWPRWAWTDGPFPREEIEVEANQDH